MARVFEYVVVAISRCSLTYGTSPCTAAIGVTGDDKCFQTRGTCQDPVNFAETSPETLLYFARATAALPVDTSLPDVLRVIRDISVRAPELSLGEDLGVRGELRFTLADSPHPDTGPAGDPYRADRAYPPRGTFFGRCRARRTFERGRRLMYVRRVEGQTFAEAEKRHYVVETFDGPHADGSVTITAKDGLKVAAGDRAQAPRISNGRLLAGINNSVGSATLTPTGIGDVEYPASGLLNIGGKEIVSFTRSGDALTITRGQRNTAAVAHDADARVQVVRSYSGADPADVIYDLLLNYTDGLTANNLPVAEWKTETVNFFGRLVTADIAEPTSVEDLLSELIQQCGLVLWWDAIGDGTHPKVRLQVLRGVPAGAVRFGPGNIPGVIDTQEQPDKRITAVWTFHGQINPLLRLDEWSNYRSSVATIAPDVGSNEVVIRKIYSRWITTANRPGAERVNAILLARFATAPRRTAFTVYRPDADASVVEAGGYYVEGAFLQDETGQGVPMPVQVVQVAPGPDRFRVVAEEMLYQAPAGDGVSSMIAAQHDFNLRTAYDQIYGSPDGTTRVHVVVPADVIVGNTYAGVEREAFRVGNWPRVGDLTGAPSGDWSGPATYNTGDWVWHDPGDGPRPYVSRVNGNTGIEPGVTGGWATSWHALTAITIEVAGRIQGKGGNAGRSGSASGVPAGNGVDGGTALYTRYPIRIVGDGQILGGGGGGGGGGRTTGSGYGGGGGGGQGTLPGALGPLGGTAGTSEAAGVGGAPTSGTGGAGGDGGAAGAAGQDGEDGSLSSATGGTGGAAGIAIDGDSFATVVDSPTITGPRIN